ncbi:MAG TPA: amidohydrolase family protein [Planctomycetota bacterium]|nr:amidohydrolase family protein [Planctomycetota bacterium]HRU52660.1 amidohydrolase family protein [Planctomycetota bacterium]
MDILIQNARLRNHEKLMNIGIKDGKIIEIAENTTQKANQTIDAKGNLVTEAFCNPHLHLCKVYTLEMMEQDSLKSYHGSGMGAAMTAIELAAKVKENYDAEWILPNVRKALKLAAKNGNLYIRAFADVDSKAKLEGIKALLQAKQEFKDIIDLQIVAFPQDGVVREPGTIELIDEAMKMGADVVGGIPWIEFTKQDEQTHIDEMFKIAKKYNADISMLVDDAGDADLRTLEMFALKAIQENWQGRVLSHHARAMQLYTTPYFKKLVAILKKAQMGIVSDPHTGPLHAKVKELLEEDILVSFGQDDILDAYYPFGQNNMLEVAFLNVHILWMTTFPEIEKAYDMITHYPAKSMNIPNYPLQINNNANLVIHNVPTVREAIQYHAAPTYVISHGKLLENQ